MPRKKGKLDWKNLKGNNCPKCKSPLKIKPGTGFVHEKIYQCSNAECGFKIRHGTFEKIVEDLYKPNVRYVD